MTRVVFLPDSPRASSAGGVSPARRIQAMVRPTGTSAPGCALTPARKPSAGDSISMTALSVSISRSGSPLATVSPSFFSQEISLPVSWAISSAGMTTLIAIGLMRATWRASARLQISRYARKVLEILYSETRSTGLSVAHFNPFLLGTGFDQLAYATAGFGFILSDGGQRSVHREV